MFIDNGKDWHEIILRRVQGIHDRGNVMDLAVAVIIGGAFTGIVTALTANIINSLIAVVAGGGAGAVLGLVVPGYRQKSVSAT